MPASLIMAMLYGGGDLPRTAEIATMAGWDTDCNAGNAGAIVGTFQGLQPGWDKYRKPINDFVVASGVLGTVNIVDIPSFARELTVLALRLSGEDAAGAVGRGFRAARRALRFRCAGLDAWLPHRGPQPDLRSRHPPRCTRTISRGSLEDPARPAGARAGRPDLLEAVVPPSEFDDERYRPMFTPLADDGQMVKFKLRLDPWNGDGNLRVVPYVRRAMSGHDRGDRRVACAVERAAGRIMSSRSPMAAARRSTRSAFWSSISAG